MAQDLSQVEVAEAISLALENVEEDISLFDLVKNAVPELSDDSIMKYIGFIVNGKKVEDHNTIVSKNDDVKVIPLFAGGK